MAAAHGPAGRGKSSHGLTLWLISPCLAARVDLHHGLRERAAPTVNRVMVLCPAFVASTRDRPAGAQTAGCRNLYPGFTLSPAGCVPLYTELIRVRPSFSVATEGAHRVDVVVRP